MGFCWQNIQCELTIKHELFENIINDKKREIKMRMYTKNETNTKQNLYFPLSPFQIDETIAGMYPLGRPVRSRLHLNFQIP